VGEDATSQLLTTIIQQFPFSPQTTVFNPFQSTMYFNMFPFLFQSFSLYSRCFPLCPFCPPFSPNRLAFASLCRVTSPTENNHTTDHKQSNQQSLQKTTGLSSRRHVATWNKPLSFSGFECRSLHRVRLVELSRSRGHVTGFRASRRPRVACGDVDIDRESRIVGASEVPQASRSHLGAGAIQERCARKRGRVIGCRPQYRGTSPSYGPQSRHHSGVGLPRRIHIIVVVEGFVCAQSGIVR
jgi:hypothetical protein